MFLRSRLPSLSILILALGIGCQSPVVVVEKTYPPLPSSASVQVFLDEPKAPYETLALLSDPSLERLKKEAAKLGAEALLVTGSQLGGTECGITRYISAKAIRLSNPIVPKT